MSAILTFVTHGHPKPKGSMRHVGNGRMIEQVAGSREWKAMVTLAAAAERDKVDWETLEKVPVEIDIAFIVTRPKTNRNTEPITRSSGDVDKLCRNVLDALANAWIIRDDSQVTRLRATKEYGETPGARITVQTAVDGPVKCAQHADGAA